MKKIRNIGFILSMLFFDITVSAQENSITIPLSQPGKLYELNISAVAGAINITGYDGREIVIEADEPIVQQYNKSGLRRVSGGTPSVVVGEQNNIVNVIYNQPGTTSGLTMKIPFRLTRLKLNAGNCHPINVNNVEGELEISNGTGRINLNNISGSIVASAVNGVITASLKSVNPKAAMAFSIFQGNINLTLPETIRANLKIKSDLGVVSTDFPLQSTARARPQQNGLKLYRTSEWINGTINGGGQDLLVKSSNGRITIHKGR